MNFRPANLSQCINYVGKTIDVVVKPMLNSSYEERNISGLKSATFKLELINPDLPSNKPKVKLSVSGSIDNLKSGSGAYITVKHENAKNIGNTYPIDAVRGEGKNEVDAKYIIIPELVTSNDKADKWKRERTANP